MAKAFKEEYQHCTVAVRTQFGRRVSIDTATADPEVWSSIPELSFLFEEEGAPKPNLKKAKRLPLEHEVVDTNESDVEETTKPEPTKPPVSLSDLSLKELRLKFPDIKDTSRAGFLKQLGQ